jgi:DNA polymerase III sliding clamp (beta) subunit (PCNA family)
MLEGLGSIQSEEITFNLLGAMKPGVLRSTGEEKFLYLIMPVRF